MCVCPCVFILCISYVALKTRRTIFTGPFNFFNLSLSNQIVLWPLRHDQIVFQSTVYLVWDHCSSRYDRPLHAKTCFFFASR